MNRPGDVPAAKAAVRAAALAARRDMSAADRTRLSSRLTAAVLTLPCLATARVVAAYVSIGTEPPTPELIDALRSRDVRVLLPVLRENMDLDWAIYETNGAISGTSRGLMEPDGPRLGVSALAEADVVVVPALAVGRDGTRLGRGGGSYDRALARVPEGRPVVALLYENELLPAVPADAHDRKVTTVVTPSGVIHLDAGPPG